MRALQQIVIMLFGIGIAMAVGVITMIKGWGVEPQSWWYILGFSFLGHVFAQLIIALGKRGEDD